MQNNCSWGYIFSVLSLSLFLSLIFQIYTLRDWRTNSYAPFSSLSLSFTINTQLFIYTPGEIKCSSGAGGIFIIYGTTSSCAAAAAVVRAKVIRAGSYKLYYYYLNIKVIARIFWEKALTRLSAKLSTFFIPAGCSCHPSSSSGIPQTLLVPFFHARL